MQDYNPGYRIHCKITGCRIIIQDTEYIVKLQDPGLKRTVRLESSIGLVVPVPASGFKNEDFTKAGGKGRGGGVNIQKLHNHRET